MLRSLLIGLDGSDDGDAAVELGLSWAKTHDALAVGVAIVDDSGILISEEALFAPGYDRAVLEPLVQVAHHRSGVFLEKFAARCRVLGLRYRSIDEKGTPGVQMVEEAQRFDLIVLGRCTHFDYELSSRGDNTLTRVLKDSPRPVVSVPNAPHQGETVIVAYDGSLQASRALYAFEASGLARSRPVCVVGVAAMRGEAGRFTSRAVDFLRLHDIPAEERPVQTQNHPSQVILDEIRRRDAGLLVMGAYGRPTLKEFAIGSVTSTLLDESTVAIFCHH